jgi:hypothetical protein
MRNVTASTFLVDKTVDCACMIMRNVYICNACVELAMLVLRV